MKQNLKINISEIFHSIQGESTFAGLPCVFVRLQGCNMRCTWCDTDYALDVKTEVDVTSVIEIEKEVSEFNCSYICVTGGEPLMQRNTKELLKYLCDKNYTVSLETNGHYLLDNIDERVYKIVDFKCPESGMVKLNNFENVKYLTKNDEVKFVLASRSDYEWMKEIILLYNLGGKVNSILVSVVFDRIEPETIIKWILADGLNVRFQLQLHKYIWDHKTRGV